MNLKSTDAKYPTPMIARKNIIKIAILVLLLIVIGAPVVFLLFGLQSQPLVVSNQNISLDDMQRIKKLLKHNDPRKLKAGEVRTVTTTERDINLFLSYALAKSPYKRALSADVDLTPSAALLRFTMRLPKNPFGRYFNLTAWVSQSANRLTLEKVRFGALTLPGWMLYPAWRLGKSFLRRSREFNEIHDGIRLVENMQFRDDGLSVTFQWQPGVVKKLQDRGRDWMLPPDEQQRLLAYHAKLVLMTQEARRRSTSLTDFVRPLFRFAAHRTALGSDPVAENRALLINLAAYVTGRSMAKLLSNPDLPSVHPKQRIKLTLVQRRDLAQHYSVSAAIAASSGSRLAHLAGLFKELDDSRGGSGFSFADLAADKAGVRLAEVATQSRQRAKQLQADMQRTEREADFMPAINHLPEGLQEATFTRTYGTPDSPAYRRMEQEIERRIGRCRVYW